MAAQEPGGTAEDGRRPDIPDGELTPEARAAIERLVAEIDRLRAELAANDRRIAHLEELADRDALTPAVNRRAFVRELERFRAFAERYDTDVSVIYFDIDSMKEINDRHGHAAGDAVLRAVAETLTANVRASDVVGRLGGDEFGVILAQADRRAAEAKAETLARLIGDLRIRRDGASIRASAAWGAFTLAAGTGTDEALDAADRAMYAQKSTRRRAADAAAAAPAPSSGAVEDDPAG